MWCRKLIVKYVWRKNHCIEIALLLLSVMKFSVIYLPSESIGCYKQWIKVGESWICQLSLSFSLPSPSFSSHQHSPHHMCMSMYFIFSVVKYARLRFKSANFCFLYYVCCSCFTVEKENRWISEFIISSISPSALIKNQPIWCFFPPPLLLL